MFKRKKIAKVKDESEVSRKNSEKEYERYKLKTIKSRKRWKPKRKKVGRRTKKELGRERNKKLSKSLSKN